jgi:uncharacterized protein with HEPN domain
MFRNDAIRLQHMLDATREAIAFACGRTRTDLDRDRMLVLSLVKDIEIIGEAAFQISLGTRDQLPDVPWDDIVGMRHRLVHAYFDINLDILWRTVQDDLPPLLQVLELHLPPAVGGPGRY